MQSIARRIVRTKLIPYSYWSDKMAVQLLKQPFDQYKGSFIEYDPQRFQECQFYSQIAPFCTGLKFESQAEQQIYERALNKLAKFKQVDQLFQTIYQFTWNLKSVYIQIQKNITGNNFSSRKEITTPILESDAKQLISKYIYFFQKLEPFPQWQKKVAEQVGHFAHLIYNNLQFQGKEQLFVGFNKHEYFV